MYVCMYVCIYIYINIIEKGTMRDLIFLRPQDLTLKVSGPRGLVEMAPRGGGYFYNYMIATIIYNPEGFRPS